MDIQKEKLELVEMFGNHFESLYHLPPLASRILAILILDGCSNGLTFEILVERTEASKSSVSTNLKLLLKTGKIKYYTLSGDRKKYYKPAPFSERLTNYLHILKFENDMIGRIISYREKTSSTNEEKIDLGQAIAYKQHVVQMQDLLERTIDNFKQIEQSKS